MKDVTGIHFVYGLRSDCEELRFDSTCNGKSLEVLN